MTTERNPDADALPDNVARLAEAHRVGWTPNVDTPTAEDLAELVDLDDDTRSATDAWLEDVATNGKHGRRTTRTPTHDDTPAPDDTPALPGGKLRQRLIQGADILNVPQPPWLVDSVLPGATVTTLLGNPGSGKTFLALDLALSVLAGRRWQGWTTNTDDDRRVLWLAGEGVTELGRRARAWCAHHDHDPDTLLARLDVVEGGDNLADSTTAADLLALTADRDYQLVVVDTLARYTVGVEESSNKELGVVVEHLSRLAALDAAVLVVHHAGKANARGGRGAEALQGAVRSELTVTKTPGGVQVQHTKANNGAEVPAWWADLVPAGTDPDTGSALSLVPVVRGGPPPANPGDLDLLVQLLGQLDEGDGVTHGDWRTAAVDAGMTSNRYRTCRAELVDTGRVTKGAGKNGRYRVADNPDDVPMF